ncbi:MAG: HAMP domain-containing sensor histidine kinase [Verrucomicrobiota bacterium]
MNWTRLQPTTLVWFAFTFCACLVIGAMLWLTSSVIQTEQNRARAEIRAEVQERVRLVLWRMDSLGTSILLEENTIPTELFLTKLDRTLPATVRFETPDGASIKGWGDQEQLLQCSNLLPTLVADKTTASNEDEKLIPKPEEIQQMVQQSQLKYRGNKDEADQAWTNRSEKASRDELMSKNVQNSYADVIPQTRAQGSQAIPSFIEVNNPLSEFKPLWFKDSLFLIRRGMTLTTFAQGILVNRAALEKILLKEAAVYLPNAKLCRPVEGADDSFVLASFPLKLVPGSINLTPEAIPKSIRNSLLAGWFAAAIAVVTAFFLITNVMKLSERRASFVSAVTHELRTPLTTFRLYSDILQNNAVSPEKRPAYLNTLSREADRLSHLVENVLAFSQIERGSARSSVSEHDIGELLESMRERFEARLAAARLNLQMKIESPFRCSLDSNALEHILFNLIDNAAKYAAGSEPPIVTIEMTAKSNRLEIKVSDYGPGISLAECKKIFRPFHKSAKQAAETQPGVGLGLALSNRLARSMGGKLSCGHRTDGHKGAVFALTLPV